MIEKQANCAASSPFVPPPLLFLSYCRAVSFTALASSGGLDGGMQKHSWECGQDLQCVCVRARACDPLVFARLSENVLAVETLIRRVFWPHSGTYETVHCAELELHRDILYFPTLRRVNTFPPEHWSQDPVTALSHLRFLSFTPTLSLSLGLSTCQPVSPGALSQFLKL